MIAIRDALARRDLRALYLGWLYSVQHDEVDERVVEPPVPAGFAQLDASLHALVELLRIDADLVRTAARASALLASSPPRKAVATWIKSLPAADKDAILVRVLADNRTVAVELRERFAVGRHGVLLDPARKRRPTVPRGYWSRRPDHLPRIAGAFLVMMERLGKRAYARSSARVIAARAVSSVVPQPISTATATRR